VISGELKVDWSLHVDTLTPSCCRGHNISAFVHLILDGYMAEDPYRPRFFSYLSLFTFAMLALVTADNLVQLFSAGRASVDELSAHFGFWYHKPEATRRRSRPLSSTGSAISVSPLAFLRCL